MSEHKRVFKDEAGVRKTITWEDGEPNKFGILSEQDVEPILDGIARDREHMRHGKNKIVARLPLFVVEDLIRREIYFDEPLFKKWLNSPEADEWRIWKGRV
jgi:hypothetical protein